MIDAQDFAGRIDAARQLMGSSSIDALALSVGADLPYFTGYRAMPLERLTLFVLGTYGMPTLLVPELEAPRVVQRPELFEIATWRDGEDPVATAATLLRNAAGSRPIIGISGRTWAQFLLGLEHAMPHARWVTADRITAPLRIRKTTGELDALRAAAAAVDRIVERFGGWDWAGRTEADLAGDIAGALRSEGHEEVNFVIVGSGPNGASPHHEPGDRVIAAGDAVVVDFGGTMDGYCSDITRCVSVGEPDPEVAKAYGVLAEAQQAGVDAVRPGASAGEIDAAARDIIAAAGFGDFFIHRTGHGIGLDEHEEPYIVGGSETDIVAGMCFSIEPGIYVPGRFGLRLEDIVVVTTDGGERLNHASRDLIVVDA